MRIVRVAMSLAGVVGLVGAPCSDAQIRKSGITGAAFLKIGVGARAVALGSAVTTVPNDASQMFWNPAGTSLDRGATQVAYSYNAWIADLGHHALAVARDYGEIGTLGVGLISLGLSAIDNSAGQDRDTVPQFLEDSYTGFRDSENGSYDYSDLALQLTWARHVTDRLSLGASGKFISESIDQVSASSVALDFGALYHVGYRGARLGARINNLGPDLKFFHIGAPLPLVFSVGGAIELWTDPDRQVVMSLLSDATKPQDGEQLVFSALELEAMQYLSLRGGYKFNYSGSKDDKVDELTGTTFSAPRTEEGMTLGAGVHIPWSSYDTIVDYAYTDFGILDSVHRISVRVNL